ncbi:MAG TPA: hypothetical protein VHM70_27215 [Polyangiaceae bacterium]|jgi:hypothetical protein|nr:hypothetical protein [Polyangiaceae bacterium]
MAGVRGALRAATAAALAFCALESRCWAQTCHSGFTPAQAQGTRLDLGYTVGAFSTSRYVGNFESLWAGAEWRSGDWSARGRWGMQRVLFNGLQRVGVGDPMVSLRRALYRETGLQVGVAAALEAPVGDAQAELGMGHWMVSPMGWLELHDQRTFVAATVAYDYALGMNSLHAHGVHPLVAPMVAPALASEVMAGTRVLASLSATARAALQLPVGDAAHPGSPTIADGSVGVSWIDGSLGSGVELQLPLLGDPFTWRVNTRIGWGF